MDKPLQQEDLATENKYDPQVWRSTSNKYRMIARLPDGMTGLQALERYAPEAAQHIKDQLELRARAEFLRVYATHYGLSLKLSIEDYAAFRAAGGQPA